MNNYKNYNVGVLEAPADGSAYVRQNGEWVVTAGGTAEVFVFPNFASFPATGTVGCIYIDESLDLNYYWTGTDYSEISSTHNDLVGVQGGSSTEQYHLTQQEFDLVRGVNGAISTTLLSSITVTDNGDGTISTSSCIFLFKESTALNAKAFARSVAGIGPIALTAGQKYFLVADWNSGSPIQRVESATAPTINNYTISFIGILTRGAGGDIYWTDIGQSQLDAVTKLTRRINGEGGLTVKTSGGFASSSAGRYLQITAGRYFVSTRVEDTPAFDSTGADRFSQLYGDSTAGFTETTGLQQFNNTDYWNPATNTLTPLSSGRYANRWVFQLIDSPNEVYSWIGTAQYSSLAATRSGLLTNDLPIQLQQSLNVAVLIAKVIVRQGQANVIEVDNIVNTSTQSILTSDHNQLSSLQGGTVDEYFHLTSAQHTVATQAASSTVSGFVNNSSQTFSGAKTFNDGLVSTTGAVLNESGANSDTRIEGDTDVNLIFADASADSVGIGTSTPTHKLEVNGSLGLINSSYKMTVTPTTLTGNRTITLPNVSGTLASLVGANSWTQSNDFTDFKIKNSTFLTTIAGSATADRTITLPDDSGSIALIKGGNLLNYSDSPVFSTYSLSIPTTGIFGRLRFYGKNTGSTSVIGGAIVAAPTSSWSSTNAGTKLVFYTVTPNTVAEAVRLNISDVINSPAIYAQTGTGTAVVIAANGDLYRSTSALKYKDDVQDVLESSWVHDIKPITYISKCANDDKTKRHFGIIADQVDALCEDGKMLVHYGENGEVEGFQYERLTVLLLAELQKQHKKIAELEARLEALETH